MNISLCGMTDGDQPSGLVGSSIEEERDREKKKKKKKRGKKSRRRRQGELAAQCSLYS